MTSGGGVSGVSIIGFLMDCSVGSNGAYGTEALFWSPAALLPGSGVVWEKVDENTGRVTVTEGLTSDDP